MKVNTLKSTIVKTCNIHLHITQFNTELHNTFYIHMKTQTNTFSPGKGHGISSGIKISVVSQPEMLWQH